MKVKEHSVLVYVRHGDRSVQCMVTHGAPLREALGQVGYPGGEQGWRFVVDDQVVPMDCAVNGDMELELVHASSGIGHTPAPVYTVCV